MEPIMEMADRSDPGFRFWDTERKKSMFPSKLTLRTAGTGCAMVQTVLRYNMPDMQDNNNFTIFRNKITNSFDDST